MSNSGARFTAFICNLLIAIVCAVSVFAYFLSPLWRVNIAYTMTAEQLESLMKDTSSGESSGEGSGEGSSEGSGSSSGESSSSGSTSGEDQSETIKELVGDGIEINLTVRLRTQDVLSSLNSPAEETVQKLIDSNVDKIMDQLSEPLNKIAKNMVKMLAEDGLRSAVRQQVGNVLGADATDDDITATLEKAGFTDEYITGETNKLIDAIYAENATPQSVADLATETVEDVFDKLAESGEAAFEGLTLTEENKTQIHDAIEEALSLLTQEDGTIDMEAFMAQMILQMLEGENGSESSDETAKSKTTALSASAAESRTESGTSGTEGGTSSGAEDDEAADAQAELKAKVREAILNKIPDNAATMIAYSMKFVAGVLLFTFFTWFWLILKIVLKLFAKNNAIKLKLPIWLGHLPFTVLCLVPTLAFKLLKNPSILESVVGAETIAQITQLTSALKVSFYSSAWLSFAGSIFLILFSLLFYGRLRKKLKRSAYAQSRSSRREYDYDD